MPGNASHLALALTSRRLLVYERSILPLTPRRVLARYDREEVTAVRSRSRIVYRALEIDFADGSRRELEIMPWAKVGPLGRAFGSGAAG